MSRKRMLPLLVGVLYLAQLLFPLGVLAAAAGGEKEAVTKININTASQEELQKLKRIGPKLAARIIEYREKNGPFKTVEDITKVKGIGKKFLEANKGRLCVGDDC